MSKGETYEAFVGKFKPKKTTDDCYTPPKVYGAVVEWLRQATGLTLPVTQIVRPFFPGGDYERYFYPKGCVVVDNPPFSIFTKILRFFDSMGIQYFLFAPASTILSSYNLNRQYIVADVAIVYSNGAIVNTGFVTNMLGDDRHIITAPDLAERIRKIFPPTRVIKKNEYPKDFACFATISAFARKRVNLEIKKSDVIGYVRSLHTCDGSKYNVFGGGVILKNALPTISAPPPEILLLKYAP